MKYLLLMAMMFIGTASASENTYTPALPIEQVSKSLSSVERDVRNAAVKVITPRGGHGSGSLIKCAGCFNVQKQYCRYICISLGRDFP